MDSDIYDADDEDLFSDRLSDKRKKAVQEDCAKDKRWNWLIHKVGKDVVIGFKLRFGK